MYRGESFGGGSNSATTVPHELKHDNFPHLKQIYNALAAGKSDWKIKEECNIDSGALNKAKYHLIQHYPDLYKQVAGSPGSPYRFLLDENMFFHDPVHRNNHIISLWHDFGRVMHTNNEKLREKADNNIWDWAWKQRVTAIITHDIHMGKEDKDLSLIALRRTHKGIQNCFERAGFYDTRHLPVIVQLTPSTRNSHHTVDALRQHRNAIVKFMDNPSSVILRLSPDGAEPLLSYKEIAMNGWETIKIQGQTFNNAHRQKLKQHTHSSPAPA